MDWVFTFDVGMSALNVLVGVGLAALVVVTTPRRVAHLSLAAFLLMAAGNAATGLVANFTDSAWIDHNAYFYSVLTLGGISTFYLIFIGAAIPSPLARPFRLPVVRLLLVATYLGVVVSAFAWPDLVGSHDARGPLNDWMRLNTLVLVLALVASLDALRRSAPGSAVRARARTYALAFGIQDAGVLLVYLLRQVGVDPVGLLSVFVVTAWVLVARAMIRDHLFDADLRVKRGLARGTVAAIFLGSFFIAAAVAEQYLQQYGVLVGGVAVGVLLLVMRPLERAAGRIADAAMPRVQDTEEYRTVRKREVYRAAVESALQDGEVSEKERDVLATLAQELGLGAKDALDIERAAQTVVARAPPA